jgi:D-alanyl-D-alanine carboxypeptidase (penicillin-binding protein 5/6)
MTALLTLEQTSLKTRFRVPRYRAGPAESTIALRRGQRVSVRDLLRALLLPSANDAAATLAHGVAGSGAAFVRAMNRRARELRLGHTRYASPVGLDDRRNYSTAADLVALARVDLSHRFFAETVRRARAKLHIGSRRRSVANRNTLVGRHRWVIVVKTGHTRAAGFVLVGAGRRHGVTVLSAVLGEPSESARDADTLALLRYGLASYRHAVFVPRGRVVARAAVRHRGGATVPLVAASTAAGAIRRGQAPVIQVTVPRSLEGPLPAGARVGEATVRAGGTVVARVPITTARRVPHVGVPERVGRALLGPTGLVVLGLLAGGSLLGAMLRRRRRQGERRGELGAA